MPYANNKGTDQPAHPRSLISVFVVRCLDSIISLDVRGHYKHFTRKQKLAVKEYAKMHWIRAAAKHFKVPKSTVSNWNKTEFNDDSLRNRKNGHLQKSGRPLTYDQEIDWLILAHIL